jgi:hypothetical protein
MAAQAYTLNISGTASAVHTLAIDNPKVKISGCPGKARVDLYLSFDGSDPDASDKCMTIEKDSVFVLNAKTGNRVKFVGHEIQTSDSVAVEIENG